MTYKMRSVITIAIISSALSSVWAAKLPLPSGKAELAQQATSAGKKTEKFHPQIKSNSIVSGNKVLEMCPNGQMVLNSDGCSIARFHYFFRGKNEYTGKTDWITSGNRAYTSKSTLKKEGNKFIYDGVIKISNVTWKQYHQEVELQPDGLIRVDCEWFPCHDPKIGLKSHSFWIVSPRQLMNGTKVTLGTKTRMITPEVEKAFLSSGKLQNAVMTYFAGNPEKQFTISGKRFDELSRITVFAFKKEIRTSIIDLKKTRKLRFYIDIRSGVKKNSGDLIAGINFKKTENLEMPDRSSKNLLRNPSFEQGYHEYFLFHPGYAPCPNKWTLNPFSIDENHHKFGSRSLRLKTWNTKGRDFRSLRKTPNLSSSPTVLEPGKYTCSFYAKGNTPGQILNVWFNRFRAGTYYGWTKKAYKSVKVTNDWKRYSFSFDVARSNPLSVHMNATSPSKKGYVWIDGLQLEKGHTVTAFETKMIEGQLLTSAKDNFISAKDKVNARMKLHTAPGTKGTATVTIKNFYNEQVFKQSFPFTADANGTALIKLPLDGKLSKGLFMVRTDYHTADGRKCYDQHRFAIADFLENKHRLRKLFAKQYAGEIDFPNLKTKLERYRKVGIGAETHLSSNKKRDRDLYRSYGIEPIDAVIITTIYRNGRTKDGFGIVYPKKHKHYIQAGDKDIIIRDHKHTGDGKLSPEYLKKFQQAVKEYVSKFPDEKIWTLRYEFFAAFPVEWWSKSCDPKEAAEKFALYEKAFAAGVKEANPNAKIYQDAPSSMNPTKSIPQTDKLLTACDKLGVKFDLIGFHPYRFSPENPDLDADTQTVLKMLKKHGYSDKTPLYWGEMMHWGPYNIPQWGLSSSTWHSTPQTWGGHCTLSYDMGWTEKLSAAWRTRSWLVALKYSDRVITAQSGNTNNFSIDYYLTPRASQMVSNTLGNILGDSHFIKDIRFAPYIRVYVFEDDKKRPVAAVWCYKESVDSGHTDAPVAEADFGDSLESIIDLMNAKRAFSKGKIKFPVMSTPLFFRGKKGTTQKLISAFEHATIISGEGISPVQFSSRPVSPDKVKITMKNYVSTPFKGKYNNTPITIPGNGNADFTTSLPMKLDYATVIKESLRSTVTSDTGATYKFDLSFRAQLVKKLPGTAELNTVDWSRIPAIAMTNYYRNKKAPGFKASYRIAWNQKGVFLEVTVKDPKFSHLEFNKTGNRWDNDCLQVYIDSIGDARSREKKGYDDNDYDYAIFPNKAGTSSIVWRVYSADQQLGLGIYAPKNNTIAKDIPSSFSKTAEGYAYRVFFPAKYLLPAAMQKGHVMGIGLFVGNANDNNILQYTKRRVSGLSNTTNGQDCYNKPHIWPAFLLWD